MAAGCINQVRYTLRCTHQSGGGIYIQSLAAGLCTIQLTVPNGGEKIDFMISCPMCTSLTGMIDDVTNCDIYNDLGLETSKNLNMFMLSYIHFAPYADCTECHRTYNLQDEEGVCDN